MSIKGNRNPGVVYGWLNKCAHSKISKITKKNFLFLCEDIMFANKKETIKVKRREAHLKL